MKKKSNEYRCDHCGLTAEGHTPDNCPRCDRTQFTCRHVMTAEYCAHLKEVDVRKREVELQERQARKQRLAADIDKLLTTGWWGARYIATDAERREIANQ